MSGSAPSAASTGPAFGPGDYSGPVGGTGGLGYTTLGSCRPGAGKGGSSGGKGK
jgi:hypothetical protein